MKPSSLRPLRLCGLLLLCGLSSCAEPGRDIETLATDFAFLEIQLQG
jgi:hypothetical protein